MRGCVLIAVAALAACAPEALVQDAGLEYGRRYAWTKEGATDLDRRRAIFVCADENAAELREAMIVNSVPFVGLALLAATTSTQTYVIEQRIQCMERQGWYLVDIVTGQRQRLERDAWWGPRPVPQ